jgi:hypothetical protein
LKRMFRSHPGKCAWRVFTFLFAFNYFAFRVELFSDEYEQNQPATDAFPHQVAVSPPSVNWETFDKDNAPKAITVQPHFMLELMCLAPGEQIFSKDIPRQRELIRDKSPPPVLHAS